MYLLLKELKNKLLRLTNSNHKEAESLLILHVVVVASGVPDSLFAWFVESPPPHEYKKTIEHSKNNLDISVLFLEIKLVVAKKSKVSEFVV